MFIFQVFSGADYGKFMPDYYEAHLITMIHLHLDKSFLYLMQSIPNSASGVFPLYLLGFFEDLFVHRLLSITAIIIMIYLLHKNLSSPEVTFYIASSLFLSPMIISSTSWILPEIFSLLALALLFNYSKYLFPNIVFSFLIPFSRQTFISLIFSRLFYKPSNLKYWLYSMLTASISILILYFIWGGLIPPRLSLVHNTPSIKAGILWLLIFILYFVPFFISEITKFNFQMKRVIISVTFSIFLVYINSLQPELISGGYIFSRVEKYFPILGFLFEVVLLFIFFSMADISLILFALCSSITFCTTNGVLLKYVDFYVFAFLLYSISDVSDDYKKNITKYAKSIFHFEIFSLILAFIYYKK